MEYEIVKMLVAAMAAMPGGIAAGARKAGLSYSLIYKWRSGIVRRPRIDTLTKVAKSIGYTIDLSDRPRLVPIRTAHAAPPPAALSGPRLRMLLRSLQ